MPLNTHPFRRDGLLVVLIVLVVSCLHSATLVAADSGILLVTPSDQPIYRSTAQLIQQHLQNKYQLEAAIVDLASLPSAEASANAQNLLVAIGSDAATALAAQSGRIPVLATLVPQVVINEINRGRSSASSASMRPFYALHIDQPPERTFALIDIALPKFKSIAVLLGPSSQQVMPQLKTAAQRHDFQLRSSLLRDDTNLIRETAAILADSNLLVAIADPVIYNRQSTQNILLYTFRNQVPVIGYSHSFVKAGALMGIYSTPEQIAEQTADLVEQYQRRGALPAVSAPTYVSLSVNRHVARSFGLVLESDDALLTKLLKRLGLNRDR